MTDEEWRTLYENFETMDLIYAVDHIDKLRSFLGDRANLQPPEIRDDMMKLHELAMDVVNHRSDDSLVEFANLTEDINSDIYMMMQSLEKIQETIRKLIELMPESAYGLDEET